jgi:hypothetical protein
MMINRDVYPAGHFSNLQSCPKCKSNTCTFPEEGLAKWITHRSYREPDHFYFLCGTCGFDWKEHIAEEFEQVAPSDSCSAPEPLPEHNSASKEGVAGLQNALGELRDSVAVCQSKIQELESKLEKINEAQHDQRYW